MNRYFGDSTKRPSHARAACLFAGLVLGTTHAARAQLGATEAFSDTLTAANEEAMSREIQHGIAFLRQQSLLPTSTPAASVSYIFPLQLAPGHPDYAGFRISAFSDHNAAVGAVLDYNGGSRTYDGHRGTDIALTPFNWNKVDGGEMQVIAAAAGTIAAKANGDATDHNPCDAGSNADPWNYIALVHADGRMTIYGHMRFNSLTSKAVGQSVAQGEYLGTAASSGNSSGPHLHFEARFGAFSNNEWIDPYAGSNSQPGSLWASQRPYLDSAINRLSTHSSPPGTANACAQTVIHAQDSFTTPQNIYFYAFYRDFQGAVPTQLKIYRPDGSTFQSWQYSNATVFSSAWTGAWLYNFPAGSPSGTWRFEAIYNGNTYESFFNVDAPTTITVTSPNGGETWDVALTNPLTWSDNIGGALNIDLYRNNVYISTLASNTESDGAFPWTPDPTLSTGPGYSVRVTSATAPGLSDASNAPFMLSDALHLFSDGFE